MYLQFLHATLAVVCVQDGFSLKTLVFSCDMAAEQTKCVDLLVQGIEAAGLHCPLMKLTGLKLDTAEQSRLDAALNREHELESQSQEVIDWLNKEEEKGVTNWTDVLMKERWLRLFGIIGCACFLASAAIYEVFHNSDMDQEITIVGPYTAIAAVCPASHEIFAMELAFTDITVKISTTCHSAKRV
jgi:hypothetical protein